ncbi:type II toxin-antitoxin system RelE/ParE family toxin [Tautonia plasticadhaerens]|uniref:type II toxin-antitoxin system RelE/ParE family toxin n=1 Tax=Tautonia plasticadhaerens TaxID=2527974 RepID=UPI0011A9E1C8
MPAGHPPLRLPATGARRGVADEIQTTIDRIARQPESGHQISRNARRCLVRRFPYGVVYQVHLDHVLVVSITHLHRDPDHWKDRI